MYYEYETEKNYSRKGALEINIEVREREKQLALMATMLKAEEDQLLKQKPNPIITFLAKLVGGSSTPSRQLAGASRK